MKNTENTTNTTNSVNSDNAEGVREDDNARGIRKIKSIKDIFGKLNMSFLVVIIFAVIAGIYTGIVAQLPIFNNTSFQDIAITYEVWVFFAVIIVTNCRKNWEAMLKCFIFFLISQPLCFFTEIVIWHMELSKALYYIRLWMVPIALTLPGGFIAYYCKKQNIIGAIILGLGNAIVGIMGLTYILYQFKQFPRHILSAIFSLAVIIIMTLGIQEKKWMRVIAFAIPLVISVGYYTYAFATGNAVW